MGGAKVLKQVDISSAEVGAWACRTEAPAAPQAGPRRFGAGASARLQPYRVQWETEREHDPVFLREWRSLLAASSGPEPIYQSPEFLQYIRATSQDPAEVEILTVRDAGDGRLLALTPIRYRDLAIGLQVRHWRMKLGSLHVGTVMGSAMLGEESPAVLESLVRFLLSERPRVVGLSLPALPQHSACQLSLHAVASSQRGLVACMLNGWRECHKIPLPGDFNAYLAQFGSKHRYNLKRQIRLLREHAPLELLRIDQPGAVDQLAVAIERLAPSEVKAALISNEKFVVMARQGLLRCYVLQSGGMPVAALVATQYGETLHLHNVLTDPAMLRFSVGTSILYLAIEDLSSEGRFSAIDLGYSSPSHSHQSSNRVEMRGHLLLYKSSLRTSALCSAERLFGEWLERAKGWHQAVKGWRARRAAKAAKAA
ncbi:GNAT family N-acetyltransferase [Mitsuaria sp. WAJ17]|uniref:GNAT family N-acetyltransferase n=1 Tax=Mitsuaria sp. WAJ17 TaxID=2761452 RepID=UPI001602868C|nr:GNAT family N-acetyltransferase [Mitsuaria sp. WAJ17]MBB2486959.1 GNAT family N-acetyltransferase [Mitsuaria sp. WAJ17]